MNDDRSAVGASETLVRRQHALKCWPEYFSAVLDGTKTFELRWNDRNYRVGDVLLLREYEPRTDTYTGREGRWDVSYVLEGDGLGVELGYVILGLAREAADALTAAQRSVPCYTCVWVYERLCRQLAEPASDDQAAMTEVVTAIEGSLPPHDQPKGER